MKFAIINFGSDITGLINILESTVIFSILFLLSVINYNASIKDKIISDKELAAKIQQITNELKAIKKKHKSSIATIQDEQNSIFEEKAEISTTRADDIISHIKSEEELLYSKYQEAYEEFYAKIKKEHLDE